MIYKITCNFKLIQCFFLVYQLEKDNVLVFAMIIYETNKNEALIVCHAGSGTWVGGQLTV